MLDKTICNVSEYESLRNEITMRINLINTQENTVLVMSVALWAVGIAVIAVSNNSIVLGVMALILMIYEEELRREGCFI